MELWFTEKQTPNLGLALRLEKTLRREKTAYQDLAVVETFQYGRMLTLDGAVQTTEKDEFVYHEMITHVPLLAHPEPKRVLVVGGGDGGTIREILKHPSVEQAELAEIDERVIAAAREFLPTISQSLSDPRTRIVVGDGIEHVRKAQAQYDVIIVDSTDPVGPAVGLFAPEFYQLVHRALKEDGLFVAQTESPFLNADLIRGVFAGISAVFPRTRLYLAAVPTYPSGLWSFTVGSKVHDPAVPGRNMPAGFTSRYYTPELHRSAFVLPRFVAELLA
ncbi:MAG: polyamine aminopropyltransferase [Firmicutes bacterium]|nr:polyamine aminopropyltransferase [Bacillota bacterium]